MMIMDDTPSDIFSCGSPISCFTAGTEAHAIRIAKSVHMLVMVRLSVSWSRMIFLLSAPTSLIVASVLLLREV